MIKKLSQFFKEEDGATAVEYGILVALIAGVIIAAVTFLGSSTNEKFDLVGKAVDGAPNPPAAP